jgi:hypothetical protein
MQPGEEISVLRRMLALRAAASFSGRALPVEHNSGSCR